MNNKGQSLIAVLVSVALMGIIMEGMMSMFTVAYKQQATVQRRQTWTATQANVTQNLLNTAACTATVLALGSSKPAIQLASGAKLLSVGDSIATGLNVTGITLASIGSPVAQSTTTTTAWVRGHGDQISSPF
jgi:Tfp pilus assembly protein PilV